MVKLQLQLWWPHVWKNNLQLFDLSLDEVKIIFSSCSLSLTRKTRSTSFFAYIYILFYSNSQTHLTLLCDAQIHTVVTTIMMMMWTRHSADLRPWQWTKCVFVFLFLSVCIYENFFSFFAVRHQPYKCNKNIVLAEWVLHAWI